MTRFYNNFNIVILPIIRSKALIQKFSCFNIIKVVEYKTIDVGCTKLTELVQL